MVGLLERLPVGLLYCLPTAGSWLHNRTPIRLNKEVAICFKATCRMGVLFKTGLLRRPFQAVSAGLGAY